MRNGPTGRHSAEHHMLAGCCLLLLAAFAVYFSRERTYADAGYFLVRVIDEEGFHVINQRWLMPLIQWMPLLGVKFGVALPGIIVLYSLGNIVLAGAAYWFVAHFLRDRQHALVVLATQFFGLAHALFCPVFELYYGAMLLIVLRATLHSRFVHTSGGRLLAVLLFMLVASCHFLGLLILLLMLMLDRIWGHRTLMFMFGIALGVLMAGRVLAMSPYEQGAFSGVFLHFERDGLLWTLAPGRLWGHLVQALWHYPDLFILASCCVVHSLRKRAWAPLSVYAFGLVTIYLLVSLYFPDGTHDRYRETLDYVPTLWTLVFAASILSKNAGWQRWAPRAFVLVLILRTAWAVHVGGTFSARIGWMEQRIQHAQDLGIRKGLDLARATFIPPGFNNAPLYPPAPFETLLLSAMNGPAGTTILVPFADQEPSAATLHALDLRLRSEGIMLPDGQNDRYFSAPKDPFKILEAPMVSAQHAPPRSVAGQNGTPLRWKAVRQVGPPGR